MTYIGIDETEEVCTNCRHYCQHYIKKAGQYGEMIWAVNYGHCVYPRVKDRRPGDTCKRFELKEA